LADSVPNSQRFGKFSGGICDSTDLTAKTDSQSLQAVRSINYGEQARLPTEFWFSEGCAWDWTNRIVYLPTSP
jgi:hypothetical protein